MGSTRLPGKVLLPLGDTCPLHYTVVRCRLIRGVDRIIVATSTLASDDPIVNWCQANNVLYFRGSEEDVLTRYYQCALSYSPDYVIRVTSDCPFVDYEFASDIVNCMLTTPSDIAILSNELPRGLAVEMISFQALQRIYEIGLQSRHREHVTYYAYEFPQQFTQTIVSVPDRINYPWLRLTLDTKEDYTLCKAVVESFADRKDIPSENIIRYLLQHPEIASINQHIEQKPVI